jgi:hypothetical protein
MVITLGSLVLPIFLSFLVLQTVYVSGHHGADYGCRQLFDRNELEWGHDRGAAKVFSGSP